MLRSLIAYISKILGHKGTGEMVLTAQRLVQLANFPYLKNSWYFVAAATLSVCNQPQEVPKIYHYALKLSQYQDIPSSEINYLKLAEEALERNQLLIQLYQKGLFDDPLYAKIENSNNIDHLKNQESQYEISLKLREAVLKSIALGGIPKAINTLMLLKSSTPLPLRSTKPQRDFSVEETQAIRTRGEAYWKKVYGKVSDRITSQMNTAYPDLWEFTKNHVYAPLLSYSEVLPPRDSSLVIVACLVPQDVNPQLKGHLKGALNQGCSHEEIESCRQLSLMVGEWSGIKWRESVAKL